MKTPQTKFTLGALMARMPKPAAVPKAAGPKGTLRLKHLSLAKVKLAF